MITKRSNVTALISALDRCLANATNKAAIAHADLAEPYAIRVISWSRGVVIDTYFLTEIGFRTPRELLFYPSPPVLRECGPYALPETHAIVGGDRVEFSLVPESVFWHCVADAAEAVKLALATIHDGTQQQLPQTGSLGHVGTQALLS